MAIVNSTPPYAAFYDDNGNPLSGGKVYTYLAGTLTPTATYTDQGGLTPNANPVVLDSSGRADIWLDNSVSYKFIVKTSNDVTIRTVDNVSPFSNSSGLAILGSIAPNTIVGNNTGSSAAPIALTVAQVNAMLGITSSSGKNYIINGGCLVTTRTAPTISGAYQYGSVDQWLASGGGTPTAGTITSFSNTVTSTGASVAVTGYSSTGTGTPPSFQHRIERKNCYDLRSKTVTISAYVYQDTGSTLTYTIGLSKFQSLDTYGTATSLGSATMSVSSVPTATWTKIIGTFTFGASDCDNGIAVSFSGTGNASISTKNFYLGDAQLEVGSIASPAFEYEPIDITIAKCQRYLPSFVATASNEIVGSSYAISTTQTRMTLTFAVKPRVIPTSISISGASDFSLFNSSDVSGALTGLALSRGGFNSCMLISTHSAGSPTVVAGDGCMILSANGNAKIIFTGCEL